MRTDFRALQLKARHQVYTLLSGRNLSQLYGEGYDFAELREYQHGDDIRKINWTVTAKLGKPYIKEMHANRELSVVVAALMDGSLYFNKDNAKQVTLAQTAMLLGYAAQHNADLFTGIAYTPKEIYTPPPTKQLYPIEQFNQKLYEAELLHTRLNIDASLQDLFGRLHRRSLLFLVSDFLEEVDLSLLAQKHEVIAIIIRDTLEESPVPEGEVMLEEPRSGNKQKGWLSRRSLAAYKKRLARHDALLKADFERYNIRYIKITTAQEPIEKLLRLFG